MLFIKLLKELRNECRASCFVTDVLGDCFGGVVERLRIMSRICFDVDGVIADHAGDLPYVDRQPYPWVAQKIRDLKEAGHVIIFCTARYMRLFDGDQESAAHAGRYQLIRWLEKHGIPYDEIYLGKPSADLYVDDKAVRIESDLGKTAWDVLKEI